LSDYLSQKNAQAPLSDLYPRSALENMHCQLLTRVMRHHGLGVLFDDPLEGQHFRALLSQTILATDMSVHTDFMERFQDEVDGQHAEISARRLLVSQALLKNADISNPSRPFPVAYHWATALMEEWLAQKRMEEFFSVETSVYPSSDPLGICKSQVFFISTFAKPLLDITVKAVPGEC
jgi:3'5'-cyclic nucleotide phosphodiesterase